MDSDLLNSYYSNYDEDGRLGLAHGRVEYFTTMRYIEKYLTAGCRVLEIGAGTGRYSLSIARLGYQVDAIELLNHHVDIFRSKIHPEDNVTITQGNALDLSRWEDDSYDLTLLLGPMYHLYSQEDKLQALHEAYRLTKKGGIIIVAYTMADPSILQYGFMKNNIKELIHMNYLDKDSFEPISNQEAIFELYRKTDIDSLRSTLNVTQKHFVAADGFTNYMREQLAAMSDEIFELYLGYHFTTCERQDMVGLSHHTLDIFQKN